MQIKKQTSNSKQETLSKNEAEDNNVESHHEQEKQTNYYNEFCKLYLANAVLETHLKELSLEKTELMSKLNKLEKKAEEAQDGNSNSNFDRRKRVRRSAADIARHYKCQQQNCSKSYGSEGSLNQHIKLKHPELFKTLNIPDSIMNQDHSYEDSRNHD